MIVVPLAADCEELRRDLIERELPPVAALEPAEARRLSREGNLAVAAAWQPPIDTLPVDVTEVAGVDGAAASVPMRRYVPRSDPRPETTLAWLHGGGWVLGDLDTTDAAARTACALTGFEVITVDYRCAPASRFPAAPQDSLAAVDWLLETRDRVVVGGDSAGGNLAGMVAQQRGEHPRLIGQVLVYPCTDPSLASPSAHSFVDGPFLARADMDWFYAQYLRDQADAVDPLVDIAGVASTSSVPAVAAVILTVGHDPLRDEGMAYARLLARGSEPVTWIHAPELFHGAFTQSGILPSAAVRVGEVWSAAERLFS